MRDDVGTLSEFKASIREGERLAPALADLVKMNASNSQAGIWALVVTLKQLPRLFTEGPDAFIKQVLGVLQAGGKA